MLLVDGLKKKTHILLYVNACRLLQSPPFLFNLSSSNITGTDNRKLFKIHKTLLFSHLPVTDLFQQPYTSAPCGDLDGLTFVTKVEDMAPLRSSLILLISLLQLQLLLVCASLDNDHRYWMAYVRPIRSSNNLRHTVKSIRWERTC